MFTYDLATLVADVGIIAPLLTAPLALGITFMGFRKLMGTVRSFLR
jgi:hypothetical protein